MASMWPPKKNTAFTLFFTLYKNDGTVIANPGTLTRATSIDGAAVDTTPNNAVTEEDTTYGQLSWVLDAAEMNGDAIWIYCKDDTAGCVPFTCTLYTTANTQDEIVAGTVKAKVDVDTIKTQSVTCAAGVTVLASVGTAATSTAQTGDSYAIVNGDHGLVSIQDDVDAIYGAVITNAAGTDVAADIIAIKTQLDVIQADTDLLDDAAGGLADIHTDLAGLITDIGANGSGLTALPWNAAWDTEVQSECDDAITASGIKGATFDTATDSLEALRNRGDAAWATATGFSTHSAADVVTALDDGATLTACLTATGFSTHSAADVVTALDDGATLTACVTATGFSTLTADDVHDEAVEGALTFRQITRIALAALAGKSAGGGTATITFQDAGDTKARITATADADGNRTGIVLDGTV